MQFLDAILDVAPCAVDLACTATRASGGDSSRRNMNKKHLNYLVCPNDKSDLELLEEEEAGGRVRTGSLRCQSCHTRYPIIRFIPRFVPSENYTTGFGYQWNRHPKIGYDSYNGTGVSRKRFFDETKWDNDLRNQLILEAASGAGRYTEQAASTGAMVVSLDYSSAVEANYASHGNRENVLIVQGDLYEMPLRKHSFDKVFCFGALQHTPRVRAAFGCLVECLKPGGRLVVDFYRRERGLINRVKELLSLKMRIRPITKRMSQTVLYELCKSYTEFMWPVGKWIHRLPKGKAINWRLLIADYWDEYDMADEQLKEMAICDMFDMLQPMYDFPQYQNTVEQWCRETGLKQIEVHPGWNGLEARATR